MHLRALAPAAMILGLLGAASTAPAYAALPEETLAPAASPPLTGQTWQDEFRGGTVLLRPDATLRSYDNSGIYRSAGFATLDPNANRTDTAHADEGVRSVGDVPYAGNLTGLRAPLESGRLWRGGISAVDGRNWNLEEGDDGYSLVARDEREQVLAIHRLRGTGFADGAEPIATSLGLRVVLATPLHDAPEGRGGSVTDARGRTVARLDRMAPRVTTALADGTLLVLGDTTYGRAFARVSPSGRVTYPRLIRPKAFQARDLLQTSAGLFASLVYTGGDGAPFYLARISRDGRLGKPRSIERDLGIQWPPVCLGYRVTRLYDGATVGPSGTILVQLECTPIARDGTYGATSHVLFELGPDLRFRRVVTTRANFGIRWVGTLPDGRLFVTHTDGSIGAVALPDALRVTQGGAGAVTPRGKDQAVVRIRCDRPYGAVCSGVVEIRSPEGTYFGWAPFALPGRPGRARAEADVTVRRSSAPEPAAAFANGLPEGSSARLRRLPAQFDRGSALPPAG